MSNEITAVAKLTGSKSGTTVSGDATVPITLTGSGLWTNVQVIGTSAELLAFPSDLTTEGITYVWAKNLSADHFIELALDSGMTQKFAKILPGKVMLLPVYSGNPSYYARADTAASSLQMVAVGT